MASPKGPRNQAPVDRTDEKMCVAFAFPAKSRGYADLENSDFATQLAAAMKPVINKYNENPDHPQIELKSIDLFATYLESVPAFEKRLKDSGFLKKAPLDVKLKINSYTDRRHIKENVAYKRQDRAILENFSETGREVAARKSWKSKLPGAAWKVRHDAKKEEQALVDAKRLFEYTFKRVRNESLALAAQLVPAGKNKAGLVDDWKLSFAGEKELEAFFEHNFDVSAPKLDKKEKARLSDTQQIELRAQRAMQKVPLGAELWKNAIRFKQTEWDVSQNPRIMNRPSKMQLADGTTCEDLSTGTELKYQIAAPDGGPCLTLFKSPSGSSFEAAIRKPDGTIIGSHDPEFDSAVKAQFPKQLLAALFGGGDLNNVRNAGTFQEVYGRMRAGIELDSKVEQWVYQDLSEAVSNRLKESGDPVMFQGTGYSYNKGLYGTNWGNESRAKVMEEVFRQAGKGNLFAHGSCGFQQEALWMFGGSIVAYQDGGKTYRYSDHGGDPLEGEAKQTYMRIKPFTDTAGISEAKIAYPGDPNGAGRWFKRDVSPLTVKFRVREKASSGEATDTFIEHGISVTDATNKPIVASEHLKPQTWTALDGKVCEPGAPFDPLNTATLVLAEYAPEGKVLADDTGVPVYDDEGKPVTRLENLTLQAMLGNQRLTPETRNKRRDELQATLYPNLEKTLAEARRPRPGDTEEEIQTRVRTLQQAVRTGVEERLRTEVSFRLSQAERWERIPMTQRGEDGRADLVMIGSTVAHTYRKVVHDNPTNENLLDYSTAPIHCVHSQNGLNVPYQKELLEEGVEIVAHSVSREGVNSDEALLSMRPAVTKKWPSAFAASQAGALREQAVAEALEGRNFRTSQPHYDMFCGEAKGPRPDGTTTLGEDPLVPHEITHEIFPENHSHQREAIEAGIHRAVALRRDRNMREELAKGLEHIKNKLDEPGYARESLIERDNWDKRRHFDEISRSRLYGEHFEKVNAAPRYKATPAAAESGNQFRPADIRLRRFTGAEAVQQTSELNLESGIQEGNADVPPHAKPSRKQLLQAVEEKIGELIEGIDALSDRIDLNGALQRFFRPWPDRIGMTAESKAAAGASDVLVGIGALAESLHGPAAVMESMAACSLIGSALLALAGVEGMKDSAIDMRRLKTLIEPLKAYRDVLRELQEHLKASASGQANEEADNEGPASVVDSNLKGVEARLRAAKRQFTDALIAMPTSATLAAAGGVSIAGAASALAGASVASKALGAVYGSLVAGFGVTTAVQSGYRLKDLKALQEKVNTTLGKDNALRYNLTTLLGHEIKARQNEIAGRSILASGGAATVGLEIAGVVLAGPTLGASLGLTAAGMAMGAATAAAFRPIKSRHRGLNALGGVEMTTGLPATFLQEPGHLNHLSNKINNQGNIATHFQREIIQNATSKEDGGLRQFKYAFRLHRALAKVIPSHDRRTLANKMVSHPDQVADASLQFMLRTTQFERHYLEQHKVPALEKEVQILFDEFNRASAGDDADAKKALIAEVLVVKAKALTIDSARLSALQDLERRLDQSTRFLNKDFLGDPACKKEFEELQVDFIVAHDLVHEALSRNKLKKVQRQLDERDADCPADPVRNALRKHIGARFARVFAQAYPDKVAYERRGAIEIARAMFTADMEKEKAVRTDEEAA